MKIYGQTFLTRHRWFTKNPRVAKWTPFQWHGLAYGPWELSLLGVINGPLGWVRLTLVCHLGDDMEIERYNLCRRWW